MKIILASFAAIVVATAALTLNAQPSSASSGTPTTAKSKQIAFVAEIWADNWFELYANGKLVGQDSVPITTERSFNAETIKFTATYPLTIGIVAKDFTQDASGLEYIGTSRQQIGDGGIIAQFKEVKSGKFVAVTSSKWKSMATNTAPLNPSCVSSTKPSIDCQSSNLAVAANWNLSTFNDMHWVNATHYSPEEVGVKEGYMDIEWNPAAKLVWSSDLKLDNTVLLRTKVAK